MEKRGFTIIRRSKDPELNPFDRQERIEWWDQARLREARVLVIGAGAIGNETLKNLAMLGIGNILLCDMDTIAVSNLSRTVLFRREDAGKGKAETAALRVREMALEKTCAVDYFDGDVVWELGTGVFRYFDVILGCLDNEETRFHVNSCCRLTGKPWIDAGIGQLAGSIRVFGTEGPCYQCYATKEKLLAARKRYSCDNFKKQMFEENKMPTVQISSAIVSALQVQEAIKLILGKPSLTGRGIFFQGTNGAFELINLHEDPSCEAHHPYGEITETPLRSDMTAREFLDYVTRPEQSGTGAVLELGHYFLEDVACEACGHRTNFDRPIFQIYDTERRCAACGREIDPSPDGYVMELSMESSERLLSMTLEQLGVPKLHILSVRNPAVAYRYYELSGDTVRVMPNIAAKGGFPCPLPTN